MKCPGYLIKSIKSIPRYKSHESEIGFKFSKTIKRKFNSEHDQLQSVFFQ